MRISSLTIVLILLTLISGVGWLMSRSFYNEENVRCEELRPSKSLAEGKDYSQGDFYTWQQCTSNRNVAYSLSISTMLSTIIFAVLASLSWEIDKLKRK